MAQQPIELILARQLAQRMAVPVMIVDDRGDTLYFNEPAEAVLGTRFDELDTLTQEERTRFMAPRDPDGHKLAPQELPTSIAMRERRPTHAIFEIAGIDGIRRPVESTAIPLEGAGGHMLGAIVIIWRMPALPPATSAEVQAATSVARAG
jgi:PAS domain-containing protein